MVFIVLYYGISIVNRSSLAVVMGPRFFPRRGGCPVCLVAAVGFDRVAEILWDSIAARRHGFRHETGCIQWFHINLWDSKRQEHHEKRLGKDFL